MNRRRTAALAVGIVALGALAWTAGSQNQADSPDPTAELTPDPALANLTETAPAASRRTAPAAPKPVAVVTPMAERVAVLGLLNKRNGQSRDITLKPGQAVRWGDLVVRLRACETTADWEDEQLTGAFVQAGKRGPDGQVRRIFSGWLFKETPSLNVVEDPLYDVWPKSCAMRHPDIGPDTVAASSASAAPARSSAKKSAGTSAPAIEAEPSPSALSNSAT
jgi:hypothetical protein